VLRESKALTAVQAYCSLNSGVNVCAALRDKYRLLDKYEVQVPDAQLASLDALDTAWANFQVGCCM
jgi:hypothetical protein